MGHGALAVLLVELLDGADGAGAHVACNELRVAPVLAHPLQKRLLVRLALRTPDVCARFIGVQSRKVHVSTMVCGMLVLW